MVDKMGKVVNEAKIEILKKKISEIEKKAEASTEMKQEILMMRNEISKRKALTNDEMNEILNNSIGLQDPNKVFFHIKFSYASTARNWQDFKGSHLVSESQKLRGCQKNWFRIIVFSPRRLLRKSKRRSRKFGKRKIDEK